MFLSSQVGVVLATAALIVLGLLISRSQSRVAGSVRPGRDDDSPVPAKASLALLLYSLLPLAPLSRGWGWLAATQFPQPLQFIILWVFSSATGCDR